jgi:hypothetical protein
MWKVSNVTLLLSWEPQLYYNMGVIGMVRMSLSWLIKHHAMKMYGESGGIALPFFILALDGGEQSASHPVHFTPGMHWIGIQNYNFACRSVWVRNLVFNIKGGT